MDFANTPFPGFSSPDVTESERSYSYDPLMSLSVQSSQLPEFVGEQADNIVWRTPFGSYAPMVQLHPDGFVGNVELVKGGYYSAPDWWGYVQSNDWNALRLAGVGFIYAPHQPMHPVPVWKLYEPGSGFVLPPTFLGQPLSPNAQPLGAQ